MAESKNKKKNIKGISKINVKGMSKIRFGKIKNERVRKNKRKLVAALQWEQLVKREEGEQICNVFCGVGTSPDTHVAC